MKKRRKTIQVMIAHPCVEEQARIASLLKRERNVQVCHMTHDGLDCLREVVSVQPDVLIMSLVLDKIDGLEVLRRLKEFPLSTTKCLILTDYGGYLEKQALLGGADYCLLTPCADNVLAERVRMLVLPPAQIYSDADIDAQTVRVLRTIGVSDHFRAYDYVLDAIRILIRDPEVIRQRRLTKDIYEVVAQDHDIPYIHVERTMRTLTDHLFSHYSAEHLEKFFSSSDIQRGKVSNSNFLSAVSTLVSGALEEKRAAKQSL